MRYENIEEIEELVTELNETIENEEDGYRLFEVRSMGWVIAIYYCGYPLWDSENDEREWNDDTDEPEPLKRHLLRVFFELIDKITEDAEKIRHSIPDDDGYLSINTHYDPSGWNTMICHSEGVSGLVETDKDH